MPRSLFANPPRTEVILGFALLTLTAAAAAPAYGEFPDRPITYIVPWEAGGTTDQASRVLAKAAEPHLGQPILVVNKPGATSVIGLTELANAKPDGYTIGALASGIVVLQFWRTLPFDPVKSFSFISSVAYTLGGIVVHADSPWKTLSDLIEDAKAHPGKIKYGTAGFGVIHHITTEAMARQTGARFVHVPQKGSAGSLNALLGKQVDFITEASVWVPYVEAKTLRVLAIMSPSRLPAFPDVPTLNEVGVNVPKLFQCLIGPPGMPEPVRQKLEAAFRKALHDDGVRTVLNRIRFQVVNEGGKDVEAMVAEEIKRTKALVDLSGLQQR